MVNVCKGNDISVVFDVAPFAGLTVSALGVKGYRKVLPWTLENGRVRIGICTGDMPVGIYGIERHCVYADGTELVETDRAVFRLVNETKEADAVFVPDGCYEFSANVIISQR